MKTKNTFRKTIVLTLILALSMANTSQAQEIYNKDETNKKQRPFIVDKKEYPFKSNWFEKDGISMQDISEKLDLAQSTVSRNVFKLSFTNRHRERGIDLLEAFEDPMERRRKLVKLTAKGKRVYETLAELVKK